MNILNLDMEVEGCVYKLYYGDVYVIVKGKTLSGSIYLIEKGYAYFVAGGGGSQDNLHPSEKRKEFGEGQKEGTTNNTFYWQFYTYMQHNPNLNGRIEIILESNNAYQLLKAEEMALEKAIKDRNCLNNNVHAYIPKKKKDGMYGWIKPTWVLNYKRFLKHS